MVYGTSDQRKLLLSTLPPSRRQVRLATGTAAVLAAAATFTLPFVDVQLSRVDIFIPVLATVVLITGLLTSSLLCSQFAIIRQKALLVLAGGYLYAALIVVPYSLTFPGLFSPAGLFGAGVQTTPWLYVFWHVGSPLAVILAVLVGAREIKSITSDGSPAAAIGVTFVIVIATVVGMTSIAIVGEQFLPRVALPDPDHFNSVASRLVGGLIMTLDVVALVLLWRRQSVLNLWLMVMCCAWFIEALLSISLNIARFNVSWYAGRIFGLIAALVVLLALLSETTALYANLARSLMRLRGTRQARQIAMDAMAASIVHEIAQPMTAIASNAETSLTLLTKAPPDLDEVRAAIVDIVNDTRRVNQIITSIRSMFKKGAQGRLLLDVNDLIRDSLVLVDLDLRAQRILVTTDLRNDLPECFADRGQLQQVLRNLILNAIEAMTSVHARSLRISSDIILSSNDVVIAVEDTGIGIQREDKDRIFEPFFSTKSTGTGIGLTICRVIVEAHGGRIRASANVPHGAIFQVTLPIGG